MHEPESIEQRGSDCGVTRRKMSLACCLYSVKSPCAIVLSSACAARPTYAQLTCSSSSFDAASGSPA